MNPYEHLCADIETALGKKCQTPKDFNFLRECLYARLHILISPTTLMRLWGYVNEPVKPRKSTLDALARFISFNDWEDYQRNAALPKARQSNPVMSRKLSVKSDLKVGYCIRLTWQPERVCDVEYLGNQTFRVIASEKTRLKEGDTFECSLIVEGEPLYLDNLKQGNNPPVAYVCGKISGVMFEFLMR